MIKPSHEFSPTLADIQRELDRIGRHAKWKARLDNAAPIAALIWIVVVFVCTDMQLFTSLWVNVIVMISLGYTIWWMRHTANRVTSRSKPRDPGSTAPPVLPRTPSPNQILTARARAEAEELP